MASLACDQARAAVYKAREASIDGRGTAPEFALDNRFRGGASSEVRHRWKSHVSASRGRE